MTWAKQLATLEHKSFAELIIKTLKHSHKYYLLPFDER